MFKKVGEVTGKFKKENTWWTGKNWLIWAGLNGGKELWYQWGEAKNDEKNLQIIEKKKWLNSWIGEIKNTRIVFLIF